MYLILNSIVTTIIIIITTTTTTTTTTATTTYGLHACTVSTKNFALCSGVVASIPCPRFIT